MKNPRKTLFLIVLGLAVTDVVLLQSINFAAGRHLDSVQQELRQLLGLDVRFASLAVHLRGWPGFAAKELRIADDPRIAATPILRARELILGVKLWPLLLGRVVIESLTLREPEFQIITDETGLFNLDLLALRQHELPPLTHPPAAATESQPSSVSFAVDSLRIDDGRVIYLDRSVREPAELQLANIDLSLRGLQAETTTRLHVAAALTEGLGQDVHIDGAFDAAPLDRSWLQREMSLTIRLDALHVPVLARAVTLLRDKIPREIQVTGPLFLQTQAAGTLAQPRFENITLKAPVLGSSDYNATLTGDVKFSENRSWEDAELRGRLTVDPLPLAPLRNLNWLRQNLSPAIVTDGSIGLYTRFEGTWDKLRVGALVRADKSEWKYQDWLRKALNRPATLKTRIARQKDKLFFHESEFSSGPNQIGFLGFIDIGKEPKLQLRLFSRQGQLRQLRDMILPDLLVGATGQTDLNIVIDRRLLPDEPSWSLHGYLKLTDGEFKQAQRESAIESAHATITFSNRQAKFDNGRFRLGNSAFALNGFIPNILEPKGIYQLSSTQLSLTDLKLLGGGPAVQFKNFSSRGTAQWRNGALVLDGTARAPEGRLADIDFRDLRTDILWSIAGLTFKNLSLRTLDGNLHADGYIASSSDKPGQLELSTRADSMAMSALLTRLLPPLQNRVAGEINGHGQFVLNSTHGTNGMAGLEGAGNTTVQNGLIKDFNLARQVLLRGSGAKVSAQSAARLPPGFVKLLNASDTVFNSFTADFALEPKGIRAENLVLVTPDYTVTGAGWVGFDRATQWNGWLVLSAHLTQEVQRDVRLLRYLLDRRGRLPIAFRAEGTIPNVKIRLDNRAVAQTLRGAPARDGDSDSANQRGKDSRGDNWLPDALERLLDR